MSELIQDLNDENFENYVAKGITLVDFHANWCGPCKMLAPILDEVAKNMQGKSQVAKVDIDQAQNTAANFNVTSVPTLILFKDGKEVNRTVGLKEQEDLEEFVTKAI